MYNERDIMKVIISPDPGRREKININFYFYTSLWYLKRFYEGLWYRDWRFDFYLETDVGNAITFSEICKLSSRIKVSTCFDPSIPGVR